MIFTRTKSRARSLTRQLKARGVGAVELHGNLSQNARTRSMDAFHTGRVSTLVATDIAARGIHVDDVEVVVHADPPAEAKAYLHRSGRTARAGKSGTVVTLVTDDQVAGVNALARAAGIRPTATVVNDINHPVLRQIAPDERHFDAATAATASIPTAGGSPIRGEGRRRPRRSTAKRSAAPATRPASDGRGRAAGTRTSAASPTRPTPRNHNASDFSRRVRAR